MKKVNSYNEKGQLLAGYLFVFICFICFSFPILPRVGVQFAEVRYNMRQILGVTNSEGWQIFVCAYVAY